MFILRRITSDNKEVNTCIGEKYNLVRRESASEEFKESMNVWLNGLKKDDDEVFAFVISNDGMDVTPLYSKSCYFVMTGDGSTFSHIN